MCLQLRVQLWHGHHMLYVHLINQIFLDIKVLGFLRVSVGGGGGGGLHVRTSIR